MDQAAQLLARLVEKAALGVQPTDDEIQATVDEIARKAARLAETRQDLRAS